MEYCPYFLKTQCTISQSERQRALPEAQLQQIGASAGLQGKAYPDVQSAVKAAQEKSLPEDLIFVGGSSFIVADLLSCRDALDLD